MASLGLWWFFRQGARPDSAAAGSPATLLTAAQRPAIDHSAAFDSGPRKEARAERDALCGKILRAMAAAPATLAPTTPSPTNTRVSEAAPRPPGNPSDRIGGREALVKQLNKDFMPLADECIERAQEQLPQLAGMLVLGLETGADKELGAVGFLVQKRSPIKESDRKAGE